MCTWSLFPRIRTDYARLTNTNLPIPTGANAHRRTAAHINSRNRWTGHLWQGRFGSVVMDETHLLHAIAYVSLDPVRAGLVRRSGGFQLAFGRLAKRLFGPLIETLA